MGPRPRLSHLLLLVLLAILAACQASTTFPAAAAPSQIASTLAKYEPPDGQAYFGFTFKLWDLSPPEANAVWGDTRLFAERIRDAIQVELAGKTPTILKVQNDWQSENETLQPFSVAQTDIDRVQAAAGPAVVPMLEWGGISTHDIAHGVYDQYIMQYARDVRQYGKPLFVRPICGEFNGSWWQWASPKANPTLTTEDFVNAWRRVVDIFRQEGVTNTAWIWTPVAFPPPPADWGRDPNWQAYYPGDAYVDWVGGDLNDWGLPYWLDPLYQFGIDHKKPFFLAEFAIRHEGAKLTHVQQMQWLEAMFDYFETHPKIKAISYFNYKVNPDNTLGSVAHVYLYNGRVNYVPNGDDFDQRLMAGGADMRALFARRIANPRYISTLVIGP
jgi:hypothetical protein